MAVYDRRLVTRIVRDVDARLRLCAVLRDVSLSALISDLLDRALPSMQELAEQMQEGSPKS